MTILNIKQISIAGLIAALYVVLSLVFLPISFGVYQVRIAEALTVLPFLTPAAIPGLFIGCFLANIFGGMGWLDIVFGPLITLLAAIVTRYVYHFSKSNKYLFLTLLPLVSMWVGSVYLLSSFRFEGRVILGIILSVIAFVVMTFMGNKRMSKTENKSISLILKITSLILGIVAAYLMKITDNIYLVIVGTVLLLSTLLTFMMFARIKEAKGNYNVLIAPLPPVIFNAFGVSLYLAPLLGFNYWFSVQMVGVGELVACYLIGLPLLLLLEKRKIFV